MPRGVKGPKRTKKQLATLRTNGYRSNVEGLKKKYRLAVEAGDGARAEKTLAAILDATEGRFDGLARVSAEKLARLHVIHDAALEEVERDGVTVEEEIVGSDGGVLSTRRKEHPALGAALRLGEVVGVSAKEQLLTPASRGAAKRDDAIARFADRQARLRESLSLNPPVVDAEIIEGGDDDEG
jgi:hypothetical protein